MTNDTDTAPNEPTPDTPDTARQYEAIDTPAQETHRGGSGGTFLAVLLGGFLAGALGYVAAYYSEFGLFGQSQTDGPVGAISESLDTQAERLAALETRLDQTSADDPARAELEQTLSDVTAEVTMLSQQLEQMQGVASGEPVDLTPVSDRLDGLEGQLTDLRDQAGQQAAQIEQMSQSDQLDQLSQRVEELSATVESQAQTIDQQQQAIENATQSATAEANRIAVQGAISGIRAALDTGSAYADELGALREATDATVPEGLAAPAEEGVPTLNELRESFDDPAREALTDSIGATAGNGLGDRLGAFLQAQTGARSLNEQEGDGADAILSRAQARLNEGDLQAALDEIETLPQAGQEALSDWTAQARERLAATQALSELNSSVTGN